MNKIISRLLQRIPYIKELYAKIAHLQNVLEQYQLGWPPGHFYSPIPNLEEIKAREEKIFNNIPRQIAGINLNEDEQINLLKQLSAYYSEQPFQDQKQKHLRYFFDNPNYSYGESIILYSLIRHIQPKKIIEIGSGYSSGVILDTNELFFNNSISCVFIEPYPNLLYSLLKEGDQERIEIVDKNLQDIDPQFFSSLTAGDILLIDSTHVSKVDSDVNHILFDILPSLNPGVYVHFHDICYPFEYPKQWVYQGRAWNEAYILRAFLQYNTSFEIVIFNSFLGYFCLDLLQQYLPLCAKNPGISIWLKKV
ncbi:class I SAM-dependent methyltransferase [Gloeothece verrucosa]|uniref:Class I SAM-dependent methyltransferase n=1 Tax=Gloeothece verrucosa (strain PCC 7822) TaxID=497965 RepID=E0UL22_GLOV7|nr:class I SAM-dependent methyltransferase [Gloeothece verrucosa]ADN17652.1 conserved hypothetical protein [Gloeothece verrucosa PCC 7822]